MQTYCVSATNSPMYYNWWTVPGNFVNMTGANSATVKIQFPPVNRTYTVYCTATNALGTSAPSMKVVHSFEQPRVSFSGTYLHCKGGSPTTLMASNTIFPSSSTFTYKWSPATGLNSTSSSVVFAAPPATTTYTIVVSSGPCNATLETTVKVEVCTGLQYFGDDGPEISVFPNPSTSAFTVRSKRHQTVSVVNQLGQRVQVLELSPGTETRISLEPTGVYYFISDHATYKVIVTR